jgi:hypothetical protein
MPNSADNTPKRPVLIFIHVPKTGGLTMERLISRQYPPASTLWLSYQKPAQFSAFMALPPEARARLQCVMGHIPFGFHRHLPGVSSVHATLLREPVTRFISEYRYLLRMPCEGAWMPPASAMRSLDAYFDFRVETNAINAQTSLISGHFPAIGETPPFAPLPATALAEARQNLRDHFTVVGTTERFDETLLLLKYRMGWTRPLHYARRNTAPERSSTEGLPRELVARIREHTRLDAELFEYASKLLAEAVTREGDKFQQELRSLKRRSRAADLVLNGWKSTPLWKIRNAPGIRQGRRLIGSLLARRL